MLAWILRLIFGAGDSGPAIDPNGGRGGWHVDDAFQIAVRRRSGVGYRSQWRTRWLRCCAGSLPSSLRIKAAVSTQTADDGGADARMASPHTLRRGYRIVHRPLGLIPSMKAHMLAWIWRLLFGMDAGPRIDPEGW